jgi:hypothetical protein
VLLAGGGGLMLLGGALVHNLEGILRGALSLDRTAAFEPDQMAERLFAAASAGWSRSRRCSCWWWRLRCSRRRW